MHQTFTKVVLIGSLCLSPALADASPAARFSAATQLAGSAAGAGMTPLSLTSADWSGDGFPDLIAGFAAPGGGRLVLYRGDQGSVYPHLRSSRGGVSPFQGPVESLAISVRPDYLATGDFDGDGVLDLAAAAHGGSSLLALSGLGTDGKRSSRVIGLAGAVTAFAGGDLGRNDGLTDLIVATDGGHGPALEIFSSPDGAWRQESRKVALPERALALSLGLFDASPFSGLAALTESEIVVLPGGGGDLRRMPAASGALALASAELAAASETEIFEMAVVTSFGEVELMGEEVRDSWSPLARIEAAVPEALPSRTGRPSLELIPASLDTASGRGWVLLDRGRGELRLVYPQEAERGALSLGASPLRAAGAKAVAVLPMRLNADALSDLVVLRANGDLGVIFSAVATTYTVNSTSDTNDGSCNAAHCSLREAINAANANAGADTIRFNIPSTGVQTITPGGQLPLISEAVTIDGTTQPDYAGIPRIQINGTTCSVTTCPGLTINASNVVIRALAINRFTKDCGIRIDSNFTSRSGLIIEGNRLGTNPIGNSDLGNGCGITIAGSTGSSIIGGSTNAARNVISGNNVSGVSLSGASGLSVVNNIIGMSIDLSAGIGNDNNGIHTFANGTTIGGAAGNTIGTSGNNGIDVEGQNVQITRNTVGVTTSLTGGNTSKTGIFLGSTNATVGTSGAGNTVTFSGLDGVRVENGTGNAIRFNSIHGNTGLGINLLKSGSSNDGLTANDAGDGDTGANDHQNFPTITAASGTSVTVSLSTKPFATYTVDIYSNNACDASGHGEGQTRIGGGTLSTTGSGVVTGTIAVSPSLTSGKAVSATATDASNNTSEFGPCFIMP